MIVDRNELIADLSAPTRELLRQSDQALRQGNRALALRCARDAARDSAEHPEVLRQLAAVLAAHGASDEAVHAIEQALLFRPDDPVMLTTHAIVMQANGRVDEAIESFRLASDLAPESANNAYNLTRLARSATTRRACRRCSAPAGSGAPQRARDAGRGCAAWGRRRK